MAHPVRGKKVHDDGGEPRFQLLDDDDQSVAVVAGFLWAFARAWLLAHHAVVWSLAAITMPP
jgi:hypothetical protein